MTRFLVVSTAAALLGFAASAPDAGAQIPSRVAAPHTGGVWAEGYLSRVRLNEGGARSGLDAMGMRVTREMRPGLPVRHSFTERLALGAFASTSPDLLPQEGSAPRAIQYGVHADLRLTPRPVGRLEPIVSLGTGVLRLEETHHRLPPPRLQVDRVVRQIFPEGPVTTREVRSSFMLAPAIGARFIASPDFALRLDLRDVIPVREGMSQAVELAAGVSLVL